MDPATHIVLTRTLVGKQPEVTLAGIGPDTAFFVTYPAWVAARGNLKQALTTHNWPDPPPWIVTLHRAFHSMPVALAAAVIIWAVRGRWPGRVLLAWMLHILVDIPTHSKASWGPQFLWPLSGLTVDGISWVGVVLHLAKKFGKR